MIRFDGIPVVGLSPVDITIGGHSATIGALPAADWIEVINTGSWLDIVPGLVDADDTAFAEAVTSGAIDDQQCAAAARETVEEASGMQWWVASRLVAASLAMPGIAGALVVAGVDAEVVSLAAWCAATYHLLAANADAKQIDKLDHALTEVPSGVAVEELYDPVEAADAFEAFAARRGSG